MHKVYVCGVLCNGSLWGCCVRVGLLCWAVKGPSLECAV